MNIFKKLFSRKPVKVVPVPKISCITKNILADLDNPDNFKWSYGDSISTEVLASKRYTLRFNTYYNNIVLDGVSHIDKIINEREKELIFNKCLRVVKTIRDKTTQEEIQVSHKKLAKIFPQCYEK